MYQSDRGSYRKKETLGQQFRHSCLGQIIITAAILGLIMLVAYVTRPSGNTTESEMRDDIRQCIEGRDSLNNDWIDDVVANVGYMFSHADSLKDNAPEMRAFDKYNKVEYFYHPLYSSVYMRNNYIPQGKRIGVGLFGVVIPMLNYNDLLLNEELMRTDTLNQRLINVNVDSEYLGENPGLEPFRFRGE